MVGWIVIRSSPALLAVTSVETPEPNATQRARLYAHWFIAMRWLAVLVASLLVFLSVQVFNLLDQAVWWPLLGAVALLAGFNLLYTLITPRIVQVRRVLVWQGYADLIFLTVLLHFSGGIQNPLAILMLFNVVIGGILISQKECYRMAAVGSLLFATMAIANATGFFAHHPLHLYPHPASAIAPSATLPLFVGTCVGLHTTILFLTAYFVTTLAERLRRNEIHLATMAEKALAEHHLLEQALDTTSAGLRVLTPGLAPLWANEHWKRWFGYGTERSCSDPEENSQCSAAAKCLRSGKVVVTEITRLTDGTASESPPHPPAAEQILQITSAPIRDARGSVRQVVQLAQDVTPQKQAHIRMMRAGQMATVGELAGQIAHEVNNPIAIISAKTHLLLSDRRDEMSDKIARELEKINELSIRVARIAQGLLSYCRPSPAAHRPIDIRLSIRKSLAMIEQKASGNGIRIEDTLPGRPVSVMGNSGELEQVFLNLFLNAIHATPRGGRLAISFIDPAEEASPSDLRFGIAIDDSGSGVPPEIRERIFEPFFTTRKGGHGTGLGLSICQGLIRSHGGEVSVTDAPSGGARFTVWLPPPGPSQPSRTPADIHVQQQATPNTNHPAP